ncbi:unnamed protein product, partial [Timema podura]|nr:unnamed protein product [Timema podura]
QNYHLVETKGSTCKLDSPGKTVTLLSLPLRSEKWLQEQAQALGWSKATKLEGRPTLQGVVAVSVDKNSSTIVEVNCETDFVARNKNFQSLVGTIADACAHFTKKQPLVSPITKLGNNNVRRQHRSSLCEFYHIKYQAEKLKGKYEEKA